MLKIYQMTTNDGYWNGRITDFVIANSEEKKKLLKKINFIKTVEIQDVTIILRK